MRILVTGGDGFCGWPTSLHLSNAGHDILVLDNFSRRDIDNELGANSLTPIRSMQTRVDCWHELTGKRIGFEKIDVAGEYEQVLETINTFKPDCIIHYAEQRSAPYSMKSARTKAYTVENNIGGTHNILNAIVESGLDIHLVHLGSMGVYGYDATGMPVPEGYLNISTKGISGEMVQKEVLYPCDPGSVYHMTKVQDQTMFAFYSKNNGIRITDLHQGIVWGTQTAETLLDDRLINRFDYDGDFGTVLNRFLLQSAIDIPLSVHGSGLQTRAFIHIADTVQCLNIAVNTPPEKGSKVRIMNQMTETCNIMDLANVIAAETGAEIQNIPSPRKEADENSFHVENSKLIGLGLAPTLIADMIKTEYEDVAKRFAYRCKKSLIPSQSLWTKKNGAKAPAKKAA